MTDFGRSDDPGVQAQLDRLRALSLPQGRLGLDTIRALCERLGNPQDRLPPVFHVAGTNGKGSVCAFLRAMLEADGKRVHVATSPHLVRYNERIRIGDELIDDASLAALLAEVLDAADAAELAPSFFEVTIAASFLAFARHPADACVVEVGLGGRFDATNVIAKPAMCAIAALGLDHERFLLAPEDGTPAEPAARIAFEKAGIAKSGVPLVTLGYPEAATLEIERAALRGGASLAMEGRDWHVVMEDTLHYRDRHGELALPLPTMPGSHQVRNAGLAIAMLRHQDGVSASPAAMAEGLRSARWPARLQRLADGPLTQGRTVWLDGAHNRDAADAIARFFAGRPLHLIAGMITSKDPEALLGPLVPLARSVTVVPVAGQDHHPPAAFGDVQSAGSVDDAIAALPDDGLPVLIAGSLYLAGDVLRANGEIPD
ncbi:MAG: folylpolyglutamate synthase/dihydrofolate synthase family protein [Pontixanthobacter sp.]